MCPFTQGGSVRTRSPGAAGPLNPPGRRRRAGDDISGRARGSMGTAGTRARVGSARAGGGGGRREAAGGGGARSLSPAGPSAAQRAGERLARPRPGESSGIRPGGPPRRGEHRGPGKRGSLRLFVFSFCASAGRTRASAQGWGRRP